MNNMVRLLGDAPAYITSPFGNRMLNGKVDFHNGTDYGTNKKKVPCFAIADGEVLRVEKDKFGGKFVYIRFPKIKKVGLYYHLDSYSVKQRQKVRKGEKIGIVGTTGQSSGIHLHFSLIKDNRYAMNYYKANYEDFEKFVFEKEEEKVQVSNIEKALKIFKEKGVANDSAYWMSASQVVPYLDTLILNSATELKYSPNVGILKNVTTVTQAVGRLADNGILVDRERWIDAVSYVYNLKTLLINIANNL